MFYKDKPIDWLLDHIMWVKVCNPEKDADKDFGKQTLHKGHANPLAEVTTSLKTYQHFTLEKAYLGEDFFWAFTPVSGDFIRIRFFTPVRIERFFFRSGHMEHPGDKPVQHVGGGAAVRREVNLTSIKTRVSLVTESE
ncbi:hypothetical protein KUCAC02_037239 [Chaenocephalus aceratus]|nr:hypothetical protein KUCAC02_037239 [Chaenocephalus aceratus]